MDSSDKPKNETEQKAKELEEQGEADPAKGLHEAIEKLQSVIDDKDQVERMVDLAQVVFPRVGDSPIKEYLPPPESMAAVPLSFEIRDVELDIKSLGITGKIIIKFG